jgi:hypothetical protein
LRQATRVRAGMSIGNTVPSELPVFAPKQKPELFCHPATNPTICASQMVGVSS